jgi:hypothetical protein
LKKSSFYLVVLTLILGSCELPPPREVYNPSFVLNEFEDYPLGWTYERGLPTSIEKVSIPGQEIFKTKLKGEKENPVVLSQKIILKDSGNYFVFGKVRATIEEGAFFVSAEGDNIDKRIRFIKDVSTCNRTFFSIHVDAPEIVTLRVGFEGNSQGDGYPDTLFFLKEEYFEPISLDAREIRHKIEQQSQIVTTDDLHERVAKLTRWINQMYLAHDLESVKSLAYFEQEEFNIDQTSYLHKFAKEGYVPPAESYYYDLKSSVSIDEILKLYRIPVRQVYLQDNCQSKHQFLEYWNQSKKRWEMMDPYFGVRYKNKNGDYLSFEDVEKLSLKGELDQSYIDVVDENAFNTDFSELLEYWNHDATMRIIKK